MGSGGYRRFWENGFLFWVVCVAAFLCRGGDDDDENGNGVGGFWGFFFFFLFTIILVKI